jgi:KaiC/GvpD/RAD55 family RecA-like ATPase
MDTRALDEALQTTTYRHYKPLRDAAAEYVYWAQHPGERVYLGIPQLDAAMRGTAPRQLTGVVGYTHSGKTQLLVHMALQNPDMGIPWFAPDESRMSMITKLTAVRTGVSVRRIEAELMDPDTEQAAKAMLYETAEALPNLFVCEDNLQLHDMWDACKEFEQATQRPVNAVVFDFARLLRVEGDERAKLESLKFWTNDHNLATFVIHQTSRTAGRDGERITLESGAYGGEDIFTHMIGVRRKYRFYESLVNDFEKALAQVTDPRKSEALREALDEAKGEAAYHRNSITFNLVKNKVPPNELVDDFDLTIDPSCGRLMVKVPTCPPMARQYFGG